MYSTCTHIPNQSHHHLGQTTHIVLAQTQGYFELHSGHIPSSSRPPFLCSPMFPLPAFVPVRVCSVVGACTGISQLHPQIPSQSLIKHIIQHNTELTFCIIRSLCIILCTLIIWRKPAVERRPSSSLKVNHPTHQYHHQQLDL